MPPVLTCTSRGPPPVRAGHAYQPPAYRTCLRRRAARPVGPRACATIPRTTPCYSRRRWVAHLRRELLHVRVCRVRRGSPHQLCADRRGDGAAILTMATGLYPMTLPDPSPIPDPERSSSSTIAVPGYRPLPTIPYPNLTVPIARASPSPCPATYTPTHHPLP